MVKSSFPVSIAAVIILLFGVHSTFAQCGADGTQPCTTTTPKKTTTKKPITPQKKTTAKKSTISTKNIITKKKSVTPMVVYGGVVNGKAQNLVTPQYPSQARELRASGQVNVAVTIDENGNVISARAILGHVLLRSAAEKAARESKFNPTLVSGQTVKVKGTIIYSFTFVP